MDTVRLHDKKFRKSIPYEQISRAVEDVASRINRDYATLQRPIFLGILNGSFMFMAELLKHIRLECDVSFIKIASYSGTTSTKQIQELIGLGADIRGRHVIVIEDIVDTGASIEYVVELLKRYEPASFSVATLLFKPDIYKKEIKPDYYAIAIPDKFIVGFGLDYDQLGRNLKDLYELADE